MRLSFIFFLLSIIANNSFASVSNTSNESFNKSKKDLLIIYNTLEKRTIYCKAYFEGKKITNKNGFLSKNKSSRDDRIEWEHVVPAKKFGENFKAWKNGHIDCIDNNKEKLGNRDCAQKISKKYRLMQSDMYNLYPAIGTVNILRLDYDFVEAVRNGKNLGSCKIKIDSRSKKVEPPKYSKGVISRAYLYMKQTYPIKMKLTYKEKKLFEKWNKLYPPTLQECKRGKLIKEKQGNPNKILEKACKRKTSNFFEENSVINNIKNKLSF